MSRRAKFLRSTVRWVLVAVIVIAAAFFYAWLATVGDDGFTPVQLPTMGVSNE